MMFEKDCGEKMRKVKQVIWGDENVLHFAFLLLYRLFLLNNIYMTQLNTRRR